MIEKLTDAQEAMKPEYIKRYIEIGTNTDRLDYDKTLDIVNAVQVELLNQEKTPVVIFDNPIEAWIACNYAANGFRPNDLKSCVADFFTGKKPDFKIENFVFPSLCGCFDASIFGFYDFFKNEVGVSFGDKTEKYDIWRRTCELGLIFNVHNVSDHDVCIVTEKPSLVKLNEQNRIHCDGGTAVEYAGEYEPIKIYALNGTVVPDWLAIEHSQAIDLEKYSTITNADAKMEFVRKVGQERLLHLGTLVDSHLKYDKEWWTKSKYELWDMKAIFPTIDYAPHLKMLNQTTKVWHLEAVSPNCRLIQDAINDRLNRDDIEIVAIA